jgi:hypothetical protein
MTIKSLYPTSRPSLDLNFADAKRLDPRITYSRASSGVYYDDKTQVKAEENLAYPSEDFTNAWWAKTEVTISGNTAAAPDGTFTADKFIATTSGTRHFVGFSAPIQFASNIDGTSVISIFAKAAEYNFLYFLNDTGPASQTAFFNLASGTVATVSGANVSGATISSTAASGWYRCSVAMTNAFGAGRAIGIGVSNADATVTFAGNGTNGIHVWGAQYERRTTVTNYVATSGSPVTVYMPGLVAAGVNQPRFEHNPITRESLGLLIEDARTNLITQSQRFDLSPWGTVGASVRANSIVAPDGTVTASRLIEDTSVNTTHNIVVTGLMASGTTYTYSVYAKADSRSWLLISPGGSWGYGWFNLSNGTVGSVGPGGSSAITPVGNGWYRCSITATAASSGNILLYATTGNGVVNYTGDGTSGLFLWGAQLEVSLNATSYIATSGSQLTRSVDIAQITGTNFTNWYNPEGGSAYVEYVNRNLYSSTQIFAFRENGFGYRDSATGSSSNYYTELDFYVGLTFQLRPANFDTKNKAAFRFKRGDYASTLNSAAVQTSSYSADFPKATYLDLGCGGNSNTNPFGRINAPIAKFTYWPTLLSNSTLQSITL